MVVIMKKIILVLLLFFSTSQNVVIESDDIKTVLHHVYDTHHHKEILVVLDIDNTIGYVKDGFGGDEWFRAMLIKSMEQGNPLHVALYELLPIAFAIQETIWLDLVQPETARMIRFLQDVGIAVVALTSRSLPIKKRTLEQLAHMNVDFSLSPPSQPVIDFALHDSLHRRGHYEHGIIFSGENDKGELLLEFFSRVDYHPKKVIFIDDKLKYVEQIEKAMEKEGIPYIGIRYSRLDHRVASFNLEDHEKQLEQFIK